MHLGLLAGREIRAVRSPMRGGVRSAAHPAQGRLPHWEDEAPSASVSLKSDIRRL